MAPSMCTAGGNACSVDNKGVCSLFPLRPLFITQITTRALSFAKLRFFSSVEWCAWQTRLTRSFFSAASPLRYFSVMMNEQRPWKQHGRARTRRWGSDDGDFLFWHCPTKMKWLDGLVVNYIYYTILANCGEPNCTINVC
ncbi:hypothetical protein BS78_K308900 [Paspalum vaginatum]|uniref:Uncharacterized protein n=1 Tax=Paspalum vaginatum TaxID=158149 RepID=A0A9W7XD88_9POAL|nr:hypothetical protein BS78_K308900 [Paspalum vaginatum]